MAEKTVKDILEELGKLRPDTVAALVDGVLYDLHTPAPTYKEIKPLYPSQPQALEVIRHSTAHVMADAVQRLFPGTKVTIGPAIENGFYYDFDKPGAPFNDADLELIEAKMREIIAEDKPFARKRVTKEEALSIFTQLGETYKAELIRDLEGEISLYYLGNEWFDLCKGPHVPSTKFLGAVKLTSVAGAYWRGNENNPMLQRIYGTAFATQKELDAHLKQLEEAKARDHRKLGKELELVAFHQWAPASPFFLPRGAAVYNGLMDYIRKLYSVHGYQEVITPQVYDRELFKTSGHLDEYAEVMFFATSAEEYADALKNEKLAASKDVRDVNRFGLKPMNCPAHALIFDMKRRSYRDLPWRIADFGRLHRYERSGVTQGLTRVRSFCQDDAHIFCTFDQVQGEIAAFLKLTETVYNDFGFAAPHVVVATRPPKRIGDDALWDKAEDALITAAKQSNLNFTIAEGEGAFYAPKIEFHLKDVIGRSWQLGTIQVDFNLPTRFKLSYVDAESAGKSPVMLHRAMFGSVERFLGILIEHVAGAFPLWLAPEQIVLLPVSEKFNDYAHQVAREFRAQGIRCEVDATNEKLGAKIRSAHMMRYPLAGIVGQKEVDDRGVTIREHGQAKDKGMMPVSELAAWILRESLAPSLRSRQAS